MRAGNGVISLFSPKSAYRSGSSQTLSAPYCHQRAGFFDKAFHMMLMFFITRSLSLSLALSCTLSICPPPNSPDGKPPPVRKMLSPAMSWQTFCCATVVQKQTAHNVPGGPAGAEVHAVNVAGHLLKEILRGFDLRNRGLQGKVKEVTRGVGHNLFAEALQLPLLINENDPRYASMPPQPALISGRALTS